MSTDSPIARRLADVKQIILVLSGKGGVGKSSVSTQLALSLYALESSPRVGILDVDLTGPSIPRMFGVDEGYDVHQSSAGWVPIYVDGAERRLACMSVGFLLKRKEDSVVWRGPKKNAMIRQFLSDVRWGELDYLVVDTPPGTGDEHLSLMEHLAPLQTRLSSVVVTTPQAVALTDAIKGISFTRVVSLPVLGLIENMSGYVCPCCGEISNIFSTGGGEELAKRENIPFLGRLPVDTELVDLLDSPVAAASQGDSQDPPPSFPLLAKYKQTPSFTLFSLIVRKIASALSPPNPDVSESAAGDGTPVGEP
ncbi:cytosolic Fe-S cluster assembly factor cfd1 [Tulasnella sp. 417]|nr:cytosolic Fe-S cluster assembly factor cfd1 [Tulasnella sp. 417]